MGRKRDKDDEIEILRRENRELKSLNRQLMKQFKKLNKGFSKIKEETDESEEEFEVPEEPQKERCPKCNCMAIKTAEFKLANNKAKNIKFCTSCGWKRTV